MQVHHYALPGNVCASSSYSTPSLKGNASVPSPLVLIGPLLMSFALRGGLCVPSALSSNSKLILPTHF